MPDLKELFERKLPWLVRDFNGRDWESRQQQHERRIAALEAHVQHLETVIADGQNALLEHAQGRRHAPAKQKLPSPDQV